jgi:OOP family OmpA-OmpF porin
MKNILIDMGWNADKIKVIGKGEENPIADNSTLEGRAKNRRVEFEVK